MTFDMVYNENRERIFKLCYRKLNNHEDAEDLTQDTFLAAYGLYDSFRGDAKISTWLYSLAKFRIWAYWKKDSKVTMFSLDDETQQWGRTLQSDDTPLDIKLALAEAMGALSTKQKTAVFLADVCGFSSVEMKEILQKDRSTIRSRVSIGRQTLRAML